MYGSLTKCHMSPHIEHRSHILTQQNWCDHNQSTLRMNCRDQPQVILEAMVQPAILLKSKGKAHISQGN